MTHMVSNNSIDVNSFIDANLGLATQAPNQTVNLGRLSEEEKKELRKKLKKHRKMLSEKAKEHDEKAKEHEKLSKEHDEKGEKELSKKHKQLAKEANEMSKKHHEMSSKLSDDMDDEDAELSLSNYEIDDASLKNPELSALKKMKDELEIQMMECKSLMRNAQLSQSVTQPVMTTEERQTKLAALMEEANKLMKGVE